MKRDKRKCKTYLNIYSKSPRYSALFLGGLASVFDIGGILRNPFQDPKTFRNDNATVIKSYFDATCSYLKDAQDRLIYESNELKK